MVVIVFTILILLFSLIWRYIGLILSTFLTLFLRVPINVGGVRWLSLFDVRVKLSGGITVHVDSLSLHLFSQQFSKPFLISLGDVRIETEPIVFANHNISGHKLSNSSGSSSRFLSRLKQVVQYCGLAVNSVHLVVLEAVPHCMIHITIYELSIETFRSREGWQLEVSCRLMQGKALRRKGVIGRALADFALPFHLSIDVSGFNVTRVGLKIADPSINISSGIFELLKEHMESILTEDETPTEKTPLSLRAFENLPEISIDFHNCVIKYTSACNQSRVLCLQIREVVLIQQDAVFNTQVQGISLTDQLMKSVLKSSHLSLTVQSRNATHAFEIRSDSVHASLSLQDALWWRDHFEVTLHDFKSLKSKSKTQGRPYEPMSLACSIEFDSLICELVDADSFQSKLSVQFLAFSATEREVEFSIESLSFSAPGTKTDANVFDNHQWGQSVYIGIALVHYVKDETAPSLLICVDDCKLEWSDRLLKQIHSLLLLASNSAVSSGAKSKDSPSKPIVVQVKAKRAALFMVAKESFYIVYICDKLMLESFNSFTDFVISCENSKIGLGQITGKNMLLKELKEATVSYPTKDDGVDQPWRTWNQKEKDRRKAARRKQFEEKRSKGVKLVAEANMLCISLEHLSSATRDITISSNTPIYFVWSPLLHRILFHIKCTTKSAFTLSKTGRTMRKPPKVLHIKAITTKTVELDVELSGYHRMIWTIPSLNLDWNSSNLSAQSPHLTIKMNGFEIITATNINITKKNLDPVMDNYRKNFESLRTPSNKVWTWAADQFFFFLPFEFNFHEIFDEFINCIKWIKIVHQKQKKPFTADSPLPCDLRIKFEEVRLEMEDDPFENVLQVSHELKEDEVYECERRRQMLADRLAQLRKKANPLFPQSRMDELYASLQEKNSAIYIERWNKADHSNRSLFLSKWLGWEIRAFADISLHGTDACLGLMADFDPMSNLPTENLQFSTMWGRAVEFDMAEWVVNFKDYPMPYLLTKDMHFFGTLVGAEQFDEVGRSLRENTIHLPPPFETHIVKRNMSPLKFYYDMQCESSEFTATYGPCWEPCLSMISLSWNNISAPSRDPSPPLPFWDKMRFLLHGRFSWLSNRVITTMLASPDPYNTTETVEMCWDNYGLDWALGEVRIRSEFHVFMRTASKYDDSRILSLPDLKLKVELDWICGGDPHDHHSVVLCAPHKLPHYSTDHDSYRGFRSQHLDLAFSFEAAPGASSHEKIPNILLYANTFRCIEFLLHTLTIKNRTIKRGKLFGTPLFMKPQLSKHFRNVHIALNLPKFYITYWMSHSSSYGFRVISEGLNLFSSLRLSMHIETDSEITRRRTYVWKPQHVSATLWGTKVHVYGEQKKPSADNEENDDTLLLGLSRISYVRENNAGKENAVHRLTVHELKASCTEEIRDACLSIADGVHRAHMLRRILSNDAIKILKLHMEEDQSIPKKTLEHTVSESDDTRGHRRGYSLSDTNQSMLYQLIDEAGTKLIAHCEQATDIPADSLQGAILSTTDDVQMINWQIDLLNSQAVLKGCERDGFILITTSKASLSQKIHKCVWRNGQLLGKKSWSAAISGMQYFAPVGMSTGQNKTLFRWLPRELIEERAPPDTGADTYMSFLESGEAVGGIVEPDGQDIERLQLQRIVSRCSCQIYFCYFSEELKTDALEETGVPKVEPPTYLRTEDIGVDCLTLKHNMLEASTSSDQYEMVVDIVNNLVLFIDPKKKELAEHRRKIRFECYVTDMAQMRESIVEQQSQLRDIVSVVRSLERQIFYLDSQGEVDDAKRKDLYEEMEEYKNRQLEVSDQLYIYISCYKQRQVEATRAVVHCPEDDGVAAVARRFEVCFEDCIWRLTENDGQIALAETQIRNFLYTRIMRIDNSGEHLFEVGSIRVSNLLPDSIFRDTLHRDDRHKTRQPAIRLLLKDLAPVGGICVKEHFEVNIAPMVVQLTYQFFEKMMGFFFPGKNIHNSENLDAIDESTPKFSFTRRIAGTLSMRSSKGAQVDRKASTASGKLSHKNNPESDLNEIEKMRHRADRNNFFLYIKIPEVPFVVSYKGNKDKNIEDVDRFSFLFPLCEFHERNWTWLDLSLAIKSKCKGVLLQQFMRQKLLSNRLTGKSEPVEGITEEEKKRIALGTTSSIEKKKKR